MIKVKKNMEFFFSIIGIRFYAASCAMGGENSHRNKQSPEVFYKKVFLKVLVF